MHHVFMSNCLAGLTALVEKIRKNLAIAAVAAGILYLLASPVFAHHPLGNKTPANAWEGFLSGLGHPVIGLDHLAFTIAIGILAASRVGGEFLILTFLISAMAGTGLHLAAVNLPLVELIISSSVLGFGTLIVGQGWGSNLLLNSMAAIAGLFHGFAYGEAIFGAEMGPVVFYLAGFTVIQLLIAIGSYGSARKFLSGVNLRSAGFLITGVGLAFLSSQVLEIVFPN